jgi:hypothetical protein
VHDLHALQRSDHDLEVADLAVIIPFDHVDAVHLNAIHHAFEFENGLVAAIEHAGVAERVAAQRLPGGGEIGERDLLAFLRRVHDRAAEDDIVGELAGEALGRVIAFHPVEPTLQVRFIAGHRHEVLPSH